MCNLPCEIEEWVIDLFLELLEDREIWTLSQQLS